jgi:hypothetical protein
MAKYYRIGVQLRVDQSKIEEIEVNHPTADRRFSEVIKIWLRGNTSVPVSWELLVEVLESPFVGEKGLARRLREKGGMIISETVSVPGATEVEYSRRRLQEAREERKVLQKRNWMIVTINSVNVKVHNIIMFVYYVM